MRISSPMMTMRPAPLNAVRFSSTPDITSALQAFLDTHIPKLEKPFDFLQIGNLTDLPTGFTTTDTGAKIPNTPYSTVTPRRFIESEKNGSCKGEIALPEMKDGHFLLIKRPEHKNTLILIGVNNFYTIEASTRQRKNAPAIVDTNGLSKPPYVRPFYQITNGDRLFYNQTPENYCGDDPIKQRHVIINGIPD